MSAPEFILMFFGFIVIGYQLVSLLVLLIAAYKMGAKITRITASYDLWWGTFWNGANYRAYWMVPFIGLVFDFLPYWKRKDAERQEEEKREREDRARRERIWGRDARWGDPMDYGDS